MRDGTITTRADVYAQEIPDTSDSVIVTSDSTLLQASIPLMDYDATTEEGHAYGRARAHVHARAHDYGDGAEDGDGDDDDGDSDGDSLGKSTDSVTAPRPPSARPAADDKPFALTLNSDATDDASGIDDYTETIENDVCDAGPIARAVAVSISGPEFESITDGRSRTKTQPRISRIQRNGIDSDKMKSVVERNDNSRVVDCIYFTQQCCECVIF